MAPLRRPVSSPTWQAGCCWQNSFPPLTSPTGTKGGALPRLLLRHRPARHEKDSSNSSTSTPSSSTPLHSSQNATTYSGPSSPFSYMCVCLHSLQYQYSSSSRKRRCRTTSTTDGGAMYVHTLHSWWRAAPFLLLLLILRFAMRVSRNLASSHRRRRQIAALKPCR